MSSSGSIWQVLFLASWVIAVGLWVAGIVYGYKAVVRRKPGVNLWGAETMWNPANVLIRPHLLTAEGLKYRRKCFFAIGAFVALVGGVMLYGVGTGQVK